MSIFYNLFLIGYSQQFPDDKMIDFPFDRYEKFLEEYYSTHKDLSIGDYIFQANRAFHRRLELEKRATLFSDLKLPRLEWRHAPNTFFQTEFEKLLSEEIASEVLQAEKDRMEEAISNIKSVAAKYEKDWHQDDRERSNRTSNG